MKRLFAFAVIALLAACAPAAPSADDAAVQTAVAALLTQQAPAPAEATLAPVEEAPADSGVATSMVPTQSGEWPALPAEATCVPLGTDRVYATVRGIYSGDAAVVQIGDQKIEVRYIGIDAGDSAEALEANRALVEGKTVVLVRDVSDVDEYGRLLRYVMVDGAFVNLRLLQQRVVTASIEAPDTACERLFNSQ